MISQKKFSDLSNIVQSKKNCNNLIDYLVSISIAKCLSTNESSINGDKINKIISKHYPQLTPEYTVPDELINEIDELNLKPKDFSEFVLNYALGNGSPNLLDVSPQLAKELSPIIELPKKGKIACFDCNGISILTEAIKHSQFEGTIYLFSKNKMSLKLAFLLTYPVNKSIVLCNEDPVEFQNSDNKSFDFVYSMPPMGIRSRENLIDLYIYQAKKILHAEGSFVLLAPSGILVNAVGEKTRKLILKNFNIDSIISFGISLFERTAAKMALLILNTKTEKTEDVFVSNIEYPKENTEDIRIMIERYSEHKNHKIVKCISPLINQADKEKLNKDFDVFRFDPKIQNLRQGLSEKYELKMLGELCNIIKPPYKHIDYHSPSKENTVPYIRVTDLDEERVNLSSLKYVEIEPSTKTLTQKGDLLYSIAGLVGKIAIIDTDSENSLPSSSFVILRPKKDKINTSYLFLALQSEFVLSQVNNMSCFTVPRLQVSQISSLEIPVIPVDYQEEMIKDIKRIQSELYEFKQKCNQLELELKTKINNMFK